MAHMKKKHLYGVGDWVLLPNEKGPLVIIDIQLTDVEYAPVYTMKRVGAPSVLIASAHESRLKPAAYHDLADTTYRDTVLEEAALEAEALFRDDGPSTMALMVNGTIEMVVNRIRALKGRR